MAKRRLAQRTGNGGSKIEQPAADHESPPTSGAWLQLLGRRAAWGILGGLMVYSVYHPSDAVDGMRGGGLWLGVFAFVWLALVSMVHWGDADEPNPGHWLSRLLGLDSILAVLAFWMMLAAVTTSTNWLGAGWGNLRTSTNQAWIWVTGISIVITARRLMQPLAIRRAFIALSLGLSAGLAADTIYQDWISLPEMRAQYDRDPEASLRQAGINAPPNSAMRMVFENRLRDGGPSATFALANSLACVLIPGILIPIAVIRVRLPEFPRAGWIGLLLVVVIAAIGLLATRSRAALIATFLGLLLIGTLLARKHPKQHRTVIAVIIGSLVVSAGMLVILLAVFGDPEWFSQAPSSLAFRLQYWNSTWSMVNDRPLFGVGPGNFQAIYSRYHRLSSTEQIADPHNFLFETLASGGWVALVLLGAVMATGLLAVKQTARQQQTNPTEDASLGKAAVKSFWVGAALVLGLIWLWGLLTNQEHDVYSHSLAVPLGSIVAWLCYRMMLPIRSAEIDRMLLIGGIVMLVHLSVSGGWTVPGVAVFLWIGFAAVTRVPQSSQATVSSSPMCLPVAVVASVLLISIALLSVRPVTVAGTSLTIANAALQRGHQGEAETSIARAVDADSWAVDAVLFQSEWLKSKLIYHPDAPETKRAWEKSLKQVLFRAGENPSVYRQLAGQRIHLYQVHGRHGDLLAAKEWYTLAFKWSPTRQWLAAQLAEIAREEGDRESFTAYAEQAKTLSELGSNLERALWLQQIHVAKPIGRSAAGQPKLESARDLLFGPEIQEK